MPSSAPGVDVAGLLASASAGVLARFPCHPLDTCKARLQVQQRAAAAAAPTPPPRYRGLVDALRGTFRAEGLRGLYRGFGVTAVGSAPATCLYLTSYDAAKNAMTSASPFLAGNDFLAHFAAGMVAETFSCVLWVPIDVTKERLQIQEQGGAASNYRGSVDAIRTILRTEGVSGIYKGYGATVASFGPFSAFYFMFYEQVKSKSLRLYFGEGVPAAAAGGGGGGGADGADGADGAREEPREAPGLLHMADASAASRAASFVTTPLDRVKLRVQVQRGGAAAAAAGAGGSGGGTEMPWGTYTGMVDGLRQLVAKEGVAGLFRGVGARMAFHGPSMAITMSVYESLKSAWLRVL